MRSLKSFIVGDPSLTEADHKIFASEIHGHPELEESVVHFGADLYRDGYWDGGKRIVIAIAAAQLTVSKVIFPIGRWWNKKLKAKRRRKQLDELVNMFNELHAETEQDDISKESDENDESAI